jgi:small subunit ribosomal protein S6
MSSDQREAMKDYETMVIVDAMISDEAIAREISSIRERIEGKGEIIRIDEWGKRKMAYQINKKSHGFYSVFYYKAESTVVAELEKNFRINENILRWLTLADYPRSEKPYGADSDLLDDDVKAVIDEDVLDEGDE